MLARRGMSKSQLARKLNVSHTWVTNRLSGAQSIDLNDLEAIAKELDVPVQALLPNDPGVNSPNNSEVVRTPHRPHVVDVRSSSGSVASAIRRPQRRTARPTGTRELVAAGMVLR